MLLTHGSVFKHAVSGALRQKHAYFWLLGAADAWRSLLPYCSADEHKVLLLIGWRHARPCMHYRPDIHAAQVAGRWAAAGGSVHGGAAGRGRRDAHHCAAVLRARSFHGRLRHPVCLHARGAPCSIICAS